MTLNIRHVNPPQDFESKILKTIKSKDKFQTIVKLAIEGFLSVVSLIAAFPLGISLINTFYQSSSYQYISLLLSGDLSILVYWKDLGFSIIESLPVLSITLFLSVGLIFLFSGLKTLRDSRQYLILAKS